jgi:hypothetical protein
MTGRVARQAFPARRIARRRQRPPRYARCKSKVAFAASDLCKTTWDWLLVAQSCHSLVCPLLGAEWTSDFRTFRSVADPKAEVNLVWLLTTLIDIAHEKFSMPGHKGAPWRGRILG